MSTPKRIQLSRRKGWRKPEGAIVVSRPSKWGNPWTLADWSFLTPDAAAQRDLAVTCFRQMLNERVDMPEPSAYPSDHEIRRELAGRDLCCWCPLDQACHADVLLELANGGDR